MPIGQFSTAHIDYIQRNFLPNRVIGDPNSLFCGVRNYNDIRLLHVQGLARFWQESEEKALAVRQLVADMYTGLHGEHIPVAFLIIGTSERINIFLGTFRDSEATWPWPLSRGGVRGDIATIRGSLRSSLPGISLRECSENDWLQIYRIIRNANGHSAIVGTPTAKVGTRMLGVEQIERLIRGMYGCSWGYMVISKPLPFQAARNYHIQTLNELHAVENAQTASAHHHIAESYENLLKRLAQRYELGKSSGLWRTSAYCFGADPFSFLRVRALTTAIFGGEESLPDPLRTIDCPGYSKEIAHLGQLIAPCQTAAPGQVVYDYEFANVLSSVELATLAHLPQEEMPGYSVKSYARFSVSPPSSSLTRQPQKLELGQIVDWDNITSNKYVINTSSLTQHGLIAGVTGSGKTNTVFQILKELWRLGTPFLIVEPAKNEYRALLEESWANVANKLRIFTLGNERVSPFRLNPFQLLPGVSLQTHIDHLKAVFNASFAMYGPMPHVLELCILGIYQDRGWDLVSGTNSRGIHPMAFPTLTDLYNKIDEVVDQLGYGARITPELKAALKVRVNSLRVGGKSLMLDTPLSIPMKTLLEEPTVLELQAIGDDDEKAFVMGLLWIFIYEYYRSQQALSQPKLRHITVIEEAHRLLTDVPSSVNPEIANTRGKAVETFSNILAEIRSYGEGVIIAEQIPTKLSPDAIKNTSLKIMHRLVSEEDRLAMGGAMNMDEHQLKYLTGLRKGFAAVYTEGDDAPTLVQIPHVKNNDAASTSMITIEQFEPAIPIKVHEDNLMDSIELISKDEDELDIKVGPVVVENLDITIEDGVYTGQTEDTPESSSDILKIDAHEVQSELPEIIVEVQDVASNADETISLNKHDLPIGSDSRVINQMKHFRQSLELKEVFYPSLTRCPTCEGPCEHRSPALRIASDSAVQIAFRKFVLSLLVSEENVIGKLDDIFAVARRTGALSHNDKTVKQLSLRLLANDYFRWLGSQYAWPYDQVQQLQSNVVKILEDGLETISSSGDSISPIGLDYAQKMYRQLCERAFDPYQQCQKVCDHNLCQFRYHVKTMLNDERLHQHFLEAINTNKGDETSHLQMENMLRGLSRLSSRRLLYEEVPDRAKKQAGACFLIQKSYHLKYADELLSDRIADLAVKSIIGDDRPITIHIGE